jgi:hypothetical protein
MRDETPSHAACTVHYRLRCLPATPGCLCSLNGPPPLSTHLRLGCRRLFFLLGRRRLIVLTSRRRLLL